MKGFDRSDVAFCALCFYRNLLSSTDFLKLICNKFFVLQTSSLKKQFFEEKKKEMEKTKEKYENRIKAELYKEKVLHKVLEQKREQKILNK